MTSQENIVCSICFSSEATIICPNCSKGPCKGCGEKYLELLTILQCPSCKQPWDYEFLMTKFRPNFMITIFKQRETTLLFEQERSRFPETSQEQKYLQCRVITKYRESKMKVPKRLVLTRDDREFLFEGILDIEIHHGGWGWDETIYESRIKEICQNIFSQMVAFYEDIIVSTKSSISSQELRSLRRALIGVYNELIEPFDGQSLSIEEKPRVRPCPGQGCLGFISGEYEICPICRSRSCHRCEELILRGAVAGDAAEDHHCKSEIIASIERIRKETKPCPNCKVPIYRIEGCNVMFCVRCKTGFDWVTGGRFQINEWFHNPERDAQEAQEGVRPMRIVSCGIAPVIEGHRAHHYYSHIPNMIERRERLLATGNIDLRILYLLKIIPEEKFREMIYYRWKIMSLYRAEIEILRGIQSRLFESFIKSNKPKEGDYAMIFKDANDAFSKIAHKTSCLPLIVTLKDGFNEKNTFGICREAPKQIQKILYEEWYFH